VFANWGDNYIGIPYKLHANTMEECDCYGLVQLIYKNEYEIALPSYNNEYSQTSTRKELAETFASHEDDWIKHAYPVVGDLVYFQLNGHPKHVGVYLGNNLFIHTLREGGSVSVGDITTTKWKNRVLGYYRYVNSTV